jgi:hypothetical protein
VSKNYNHLEEVLKCLRRDILTNTK